MVGSSATRGLVHASGAGADADAGVRWCRDEDEWLLRESSVEVAMRCPRLLYGGFAEHRPAAGSMGATNVHVKSTVV
jgi:hypothetical protein